MIREIKSYRWGGNDSPTKHDDHSMDELRYYIMSINNKFETTKKSDLLKNKEKFIKLLKKRL